MSNDEKLRKLIIAAMLAAITCVATMVIRIPSPMQGYVNLGDAFVLLSGFILGPLYGSVAAGLGSCLADLISGYTIYVPGTFVIKLLVALCAAIAYKKSRSVLSCIVGSVIGETVMVLGYFGYAAVIMGNGLSAVLSIPGNIFQGVVGIVIAVVLIRIFSKNDIIREMLNF